MTPSRTIRNTFWLAATVNILGVPLLTRMFTNQHIVDVDPELFSTPSLILIVAWGFAYLAASAAYQRVPYFSLVFAAEKLFYGAQWSLWMAGERPSLGEIWAQDLFAGFWYTVYGVVDTGFGLFFLYVFLRFRKSSN